MIRFDEAVALVGTAAAPLGKEIVRLNEAAGRVLAEPVTARIDAPRSDVSAMDGFALRDADLAGFPVSLRVVGTSFPGRRHSGAIGPGESVRIFTGGPVPEGADRVVIQENVRRDGDQAVIDAAPEPARHVRTQGLDFAAGDILLEAGRLLDPRALIAAAGADVGEVAVWRRPLLTILGTGDELVDPGTAAGIADAIPESVSLGIAQLARDWGADCVGSVRLRDELATMKRAAAAAVGESDVVVVSGGASVGEKDFARTMFEDEGLALIFSKVAIKPGKPVWLGRAGRSLVIGLPGNPTSALVTGRLLLAPLLAGLSGRDPGIALRWRRAPLAAAVEACRDRETFVRARWQDDAVLALPNQDSSAQKTLADAELLIRRPIDAPAAAAGEIVELLEF